VQAEGGEAGFSGIVDDVGDIGPEHGGVMFGVVGRIDGGFQFLVQEVNPEIGPQDGFTRPVVEGAGPVEDELKSESTTTSGALRTSAHLSTSQPFRLPACR
jgi:hypothetical protein